MSRKLPVVKYNNKLYFWDDRLRQLRNIEDSYDTLSFQDVNMTKLEEA